MLLYEFRAIQNADIVLIYFSKTMSSIPNVSTTIALEILYSSSTKQINYILYSGTLAVPSRCGVTRICVEKLFRNNYIRRYDQVRY